MREIPISEFIDGYEEGLITEVVFVGNNINRLYGRSVKGQGNNPKGYEIVWSKVP